MNTSEKTGGAAVAANRLMAALNNNGVKAKMLVRDKETEDLSVVELGRRTLQRWRFLWERWCIFCRLRFSKAHLFSIDTGQCGADITRLREFKEADVVHLHWINQGMLSLRSIRKILDSGKPVVWTMHDIWPATAVCHVALDCKKYVRECAVCPLLPHGALFGDLSKSVWNKKKQLFSHRNGISFVACSRWLAGEANRSKSLAGHKVAAIPNPIDTRVFCPADKSKARKTMGLPTDKRLICFIAQRVTNKNKGISYLLKACDTLAAEHPETLGDMGIVILGDHADEFDGQFKYPVYAIDYTSDTRKIVDIYNSVDVFVTPSLSENLPNTIMEAMACGVPCVGFNVGGIPEMIDHLKNGYVAAYKNANDIATGIHRVLFGSDYQAMSEAAVRKVSANYSQQAVAMRYIEVYNQALAYRRYKI